MRPRLVLLLRIGIALLFAVIAVRVLMSEFSSLSLAEVGKGLTRIGWGAVGGMMLATMAAYAAVATYDSFALRYAGKSLSLRRSALSSAGSYAISNLLGFPLFTGNAVRFWLFEAWGFGAGDVAIASIAGTIVCNLTLALIAGISLIAAPDLVTRISGLSAGWGVGAGLAITLLAVAVIGLAVVGPRTLKLGRISINRPGPLLLLQLPACAIDYVGTAAVLYIPMSQILGMDFLPFVALFSIAKLIGIVSNVPGGLGVFEAVMASVIYNVSASDLAAALIAYRAIFYLAPFGIAASAVAVHSLRRTSRRSAPRQPSTPSD